MLSLVSPLSPLRGLATCSRRLSLHKSHWPQSSVAWLGQGSSPPPPPLPGLLRLARQLRARPLHALSHPMSLKPQV